MRELVLKRERDGGGGPSVPLMQLSDPEVALGMEATPRNGIETAQCPVAPQPGAAPARRPAGPARRKPCLPA